MAEAGRHLALVLEQAVPGISAAARAQLRDVTMRASALRGTLSDAQSDLSEGLSGRQLRRFLEGMGLSEIEATVNDALWQQGHKRLPRRCFVAVDLTLIPYHGEPFEDEAELRRCKALQGTTWFHAFATLNVVMNGKRYTLAATFVSKPEKTAQVLDRLLENVLSRGLRIECLLADKGFCTKACIEALRRRGVAFVIPLALRGRAAKNLQRGRRGYLTTHTMAGIDLTVAIVVKRNLGKYHDKKPGNQYFPYIYDGFSATPKAVDKMYRKRGGIETSYRLANQARARTTSRRPAIRFYLFAVALLLQNAWITTTWIVSKPTQGRQGRTRPPGFFSFKRFLRTLAAHIERVRHRILNVTQISGEK
jgi:hypothetical protein